jgi:hypothetical protein
MNTNTRALLAVSVATTILGVLGACGGNSTSTPGSAASPTTGPSPTAAASSPGSSPTSSAAPVLVLAALVLLTSAAAFGVVPHRVGRIELAPVLREP